MEILFLPLAEEDLEQIYLFYAEKSVNVAHKIYHSILDEIEILLQFPKIASVELCLENEETEFRSLVVFNGKFKVIYFIDKEFIYVTHVWCCRENPAKLKLR